MAQIHRRLRAALAASAVTLACLPALAGRPLQTEDAGVIERGACEVEGVWSRLTEAGIRANGQSLQLGCGVGGDTQLSLAATRAKSAGVNVP